MMTNPNTVAAPPRVGVSEEEYAELGRLACRWQALERAPGKEMLREDRLAMVTRLARELNRRSKEATMIRMFRDDDPQIVCRRFWDGRMGFCIRVKPQRIIWAGKTLGDAHVEFVFRFGISHTKYQANRRRLADAASSPAGLDSFKLEE